MGKKTIIPVDVDDASGACVDCPLRRHDEMICSIGDREIGDEHWLDAAPAWCPIRQGPVVFKRKGS